MRFLSLLIGKTILKLLRLSGRSGSALPGLVVEKLHPKFLSATLSHLPQGVVLLTGTNGKTTTTKITTALLEAQGLRVVTNKSGSNFVRGIVTTVLDKATWNGRLPYDIAVIELDEAHAVHFVHRVKPRGVVVLNIMRDQMDRFGEIDTTTKLLSKVTTSATDWLVLNANDERVATLQNGAQTLWYGHSKDLRDNFVTDDELHHDDDITYTQAGVMSVELLSYDTDGEKIRVGTKIERFKSPLSGSHNAINLTASLATLRAVLPEFDMAKTIGAVTALEPAFGRGEVIHLTNGSSVTLQLVKNPGGFTHALRMLEIHRYSLVGIVINDDYADGRDVSWLWDIDFDILKKQDVKILTGGTRGYDMSVRLKYDEVSTQSTELDVSKFVELVNTTADTSHEAIIFCTYSAMLKIRTAYKQYSKDVYKVNV